MFKAIEKLMVLVLILVVILVVTTTIVEMQKPFRQPQQKDMMSAESYLSLTREQIGALPIERTGDVLNALKERIIALEEEVAGIKYLIIQDALKDIAPSYDQQRSDFLLWNDAACVLGNKGNFKNGYMKGGE